MAPLLFLLLLAAARAAAAPAPRPSPTAPPGWAPNFRHAGALEGSNLESSPFSLGGRLYLMASQMGPFAPDGQCHSFFCVLDMATGAKVSCPNASTGFAFQSAVTALDGARVWVFGTAQDRCTHCAGGWGCGACDAASNACYVGAWSSAGPAAGGGAWAWEGPFHALDTPRDSAGVAINIPNVAVGPVPAGTVVPGVGAIQAFMAIEGNTPGSDGNFLAVNVGSDGDLGANWVNLNYSTHSLGPYQDVCQAGGCPSARYANGWFYVMGGGVDLARSRNLSHGSWERPPLDPVVWGCTDGWEDCSPGSDVARIADGYFTEYWAQGGDRGMREYLKNITEWNWSSSDVDFCEHQGVTYFICAWRVERGRARAWLRGALSLPRPPFHELACNRCVTAPPPPTPPSALTPPECRAPQTR